jgi:hypothetical protein
MRPTTQRRKLKTAKEKFQVTYKGKLIKIKKKKIKGI